MTKQPYLDRLFRAAQECTGEQIPDMWEARGERHLAGVCVCWQKLEYMRTHGHLIGFRPTLEHVPAALEDK